MDKIGEKAFIISTSEIFKIIDGCLTLQFEKIDGEYKEVPDSESKYYILENGVKYCSDKLIIGIDNIRKINIETILHGF